MLVPFKVSLTGRAMLTQGVLQLTFVRCDRLPLPFIAGQYITFLIPNQEGKLIRRSYSLANSPKGCHLLEIAITRVDGGFATHYLFNLKLGDALFCTGPLGRLVLPEKDDTTHYVLVATGTGVAPYRSMLPALSERLEQNQALRVSLLFGVRYGEDLFYMDDFLAYSEKYKRFHFRACLSRATSLLEKYHYGGYVQTAFETLDLHPTVDVVYLCGNPYMIDESIEKLKKMGFDAHHIKYEKYFPANSLMKKQR